MKIEKSVYYSVPDNTLETSIPTAFMD